ncbi:putative Non-heme chloroperoxidase [Hypsibius exemplaris]|uniref:Non-heme chloroperoxidase n=1 Tax=Hypsibius exemplaris TaxID=2072580 RepID=A0A1W0X373_HYPEX|nr:putative Non-heme chloroperoxidase [Hypsibius exemplaris]
MVFSHGWPLNIDAWDAQVLFFGQLDYRVIAHDRRGHDRSGQTWNGNNMDTYADDLFTLLRSTWRRSSWWETPPAEKWHVLSADTDGKWLLRSFLSNR